MTERSDDGSQSTDDFLVKRFLYTGKEQRREARENYEEKCERKLLSAIRNKPRWCPELTEWPAWNEKSKNEVHKKMRDPSTLPSNSQYPPQQYSVNRPVNPYPNNNPYGNGLAPNNPYGNGLAPNNPYGNGLAPNNPYGNGLAPNNPYNQNPNSGQYKPTQVDTGQPQPFPSYNNVNSHSLKSKIGHKIKEEIIKKVG